MLEFFKQFANIKAVMSEKADGSMKIFPAGEVWEKNRQNRAVFLKKNGIDPKLVVSGDLIHGNRVKIIENSKEQLIAGTDALVTERPNLFLAVTVADCVPIFFFEKKKGIVGLAHAGWKGTVGNLLENTLAEILRLGGEVGNLHVAIGPGINKCHFEIKEDVLAEFSAHQNFITRKDGKTFANLKGIILGKLLIAGIPEQNIENDSTCTFCNEKLFSYRRDKPEITQAMIATIGILK